MFRPLPYAALMAAMAFATPAQAVDLELYRFFGECDAEFEGKTNPNEAVTECGVITTLINKFNAENELGATVNDQFIAWGPFYDKLAASYSSNAIPDISVMHSYVLPDYARRGLVEDLGPDFEAAGINLGNVVEYARDSVTVDGKTYAMPFDVHAILMHANIDVLEEAGLAENGQAVVPTSPEEMLEQARIVKETTGKYYIVTESGASNVMPVRIFLAWLWQQGSDIVDADGNVTLQTPEAIKAAQLLKDFYAEGYINSSHDLPGAQQAFFNGESTYLVNGTWVVNQYSAAAEDPANALKDYRALDFFNLYGEPGTFSGAHTWVIPADPNRPAEEREAAVAFLEFLYENNASWARTGHLSVRADVLESPEYAALPHREDYPNTADWARTLDNDLPNQRGILNELAAALSPMWLTDASVEDVLAEAQRQVERIVRRR